MGKRTCSIEGCERPHYLRGWCRMHYARWFKTGDVGRPEPMREWHGDGGVGSRRRRLYMTWAGMLSRCRNPNAERYGQYGGRGIRVCDDWHSYPEFRSWALASGYRDDLFIERRNNDGNYCPENCEWIDHSQQQRNTQRSRWFTLWDETKVLSEWALDPRCVVSYGCLIQRANADWDFERAVITPSRVHKRKAAR